MRGSGNINYLPSITLIMLTGLSQKEKKSNNSKPIVLKNLTNITNDFNIGNGIDKEISKNN